MFWSLRRFVFFYKKPAIFYKKLSTTIVPPTKIDEDDGFSFDNINKIDKTFETKFKIVVKEMDFKPPFDLKEAKNRLRKGDLFFVIWFNDEIAGWRWLAKESFYFDDFNCNLKIRDDHVYAYNLFVNEKHRGKNLGARLIIACEPFLKKNNINATWDIIYDWNLPAQKTVKKAGYKKIGCYRLINLFGFKFHKYPDLIKA